MRGEEAYQPTLEAINIGYTLIDTASIYRNEEAVGRAIRDSGKARADLFITSKLSPKEQGYDGAMKAFEGSLKRLGVEYIDLYLIHWPGVSGYLKESSEQIEIRTQSWLALEKLYKDGLCRSIGVSNFCVEHIDRLINDDRTTIVPAVNQVELHPMLRQMKLNDYCNDNNIIIQAYASLIRGEMWDNSIIKEVSINTNKTMAQVLLRWAIQHNFVVIPKSNNINRLNENNDVFSFSISIEDMIKLDNMDIGYHCCWDPNGIP